MRQKKHSKTFIIFAAVCFVFLISGIIAAGVAAYFVVNLEIPDLKSFDNRKVVQSTKIYDRTGQILLWDVHQDIQRTVVPFDEISRNVKNATVAIEDSTFYSHNGIDFRAVARAIFVNLKTMAFTQGFSTITQQLIKNTFLTREKSLTRKLKEIILTLKVEKNLSKEEILDLYLNEIPYGGSNYGIEAASENFLGKHASELTLAESAYLAALPQAPSYYSPYGNHMAELTKRKSTVLARMKDLGFITEQEAETADKEKVKFLSKGDKNIKAPHFSIYVQSYLEEKYGQDMVEQGGLKVITTLDYDYQQKAEKTVAKYVEDNKIKFNASNAGLVALDPKTGQILAMVGSKNYFGPEEEDGNYNITIARRQPGSAIKPFVYASAVQKGFTPETVLFDLPTEFNASCNPDGTPKADVKDDVCYMPKDADGSTRGPVTMRQSLAQSLNIPSVKILYLNSIADSIQTIKDFGISTLNDPNRYGLTLVLGGGEVMPLELTGAYAALANDGNRNPTTPILKIENANGRVLEEFTPKPQRAVDENTARIITNILSDDKARAPIFGYHSALYFQDYDVAIKTGTTNDFRDAWVMGYTPNLAVGIWVGNNDNTPMVYKTASIIAAPFWRDYMLQIMPDRPKENFTKPVPQYPASAVKPFLKGQWRGGKTYKVDKISGKLATPATPPEMIEERVLTEVHSELYWIDKNNPNGPAPANPADDPQFVLWETPVRNWAQKQGYNDQTPTDAGIPKEYDDVHKPEYFPKVAVTSPTIDVQFPLGGPIRVSASYSGKFAFDQADFFLDDKYLGSLNRQPLEFVFTPNPIIFNTGPMNLKVVVYDKVRNKSETTKEIILTRVVE